MENAVGWVMESEQNNFGANAQSNVFSNIIKRMQKEIMSSDL